MEIIDEYKFKYFITCLIARPIKSGKTTLLEQY